MTTDPTPRPSPSADFFEFGPFRLEVSTRSLYRGDEFVSVTPKALDTLFVLVEEAGRLVTKDELMQRVWPDAFVEEGSIANNISMLRKILNPYFGDEGPIATVARRGYRFTAPVQLRNAQAHISVSTDSGSSLAEAARKAVAMANDGAARRRSSASLRWPITIAAGVMVAAAAGIMLSPRITRTEASATTSAQHFYSLGLGALRNHEISRSIAMLEQAIKEDPDYALAHSTLSIAWRVQGHDQRSKEYAARAFELSSRLGREEQLGVQGAYYEVMSDTAMAIEKYQALWNFYPENPAYGLKLVHQQLLAARMPDARRTLDQMRALPPPSDTDPRFDQVEADWFFRSGRYEDAMRVAAKGVEHARARQSTQLTAWLLFVQGRSATCLGMDAAPLFAESKSLFEQLGDRAGVADVLRGEAQRYGNRGELDEAQRRLDEAIEIATTIGYQRIMPDLEALKADLASRRERSGGP